MKRLRWIVLGLVCLLPFGVKAYVNYDITNYLIDATILEDGDLLVKELIVLEGTFHGYVRDITYKNSKLNSLTNGYSQNEIYNAKGLTDVKIAAKKVEEEISFHTFDELFQPLERVYYDEDAENGNYLETSIQDGKSYKMYYEGNDDAVAYFLTYRIKSPVVIHQDVAELYWTFIGDYFDDKIHNLQIKVHLPSADTTDKYRVWAHGDITGNIEKLDNQTVLASIKSLNKNNSLDLRITFDSSLILQDEFLNKVEDEALPGILEVETRRAELANEQRKTAKFIYAIVSWVSSIFLLGLILWWIIVYFRYDREYKSSFKNPYNREFIDDYNVEVVDYLMNATVTSNAMAASILNLVYKKNIAVVELDKDKKKKNYQFTLVNRENTTDTEDVLLDFLFEVVGKEGKFTTKQLDQYAKGSKTYATFQSKYATWLRCVKKDGERCQFYEKNGVPIVSAIFFLLISILISFALYYYQVDFIPGFLVFPFSFAFLIYSLLIKRRTVKGNEDYVRWQAFKRFLKDFGKFDTKELPEVVLWERYLVYATVFGLADQVEKAMNTKIQEFNINDTMVGYYPSYLDLHLARSIQATVHSSIQGASVAQARASSMSSGSGGGGGFSSGGGFGGGGGGGHGF